MHKKKLLVILVLILFHTGYGQDLINKNLTKFQWITDYKINEINLGDFNKIGLTKLRIPIDSLKKDYTIWSFTKDKIIIQEYNVNKGLNVDSIICYYEYKDKELNIYHFIQDSTVWKYSLGIVSTTNYILLIRKRD